MNAVRVEDTGNIQSEMNAALIKLRFNLWNDHSLAFFPADAMNLRNEGP